MRDRAWRRWQGERYKARQYHDVRERMGTEEAERRREIGFSDTRHTLDCGHRCFMCHGSKLIYGHTADRQQAQREIITQLRDASV